MQLSTFSAFLLLMADSLDFFSLPSLLTILFFLFSSLSVKLGRFLSTSSVFKAVKSSPVFRSLTFWLSSSTFSCSWITESKSLTSWLSPSTFSCSWITESKSRTLFAPKSSSLTVTPLGKSDRGLGLRLGTWSSWSDPNPPFDAVKCSSPFLDS